MQSYDKKPSFYWFQWILFTLCTIGLIIWISLFIQNISIPLAYRSSFTVISLRMTIFAHIFILACILCLIAFRDNNGCQIFWFIVYAICYILLLIGLGTLGREYSQCNREPYNLCNGLDLCCKNEIHTNPAFNCPNTLDCPPGTFEIKANGDFEGLFWLHFILFFMQCVWLAVYLYFLISKKDLENEEEEEEKEEEEPKKENEDEFTKKPPEEEVENTKINFNLQPKIHGLKKRK
jgi:hypothetical protein